MLPWREKACVSSKNRNVILILLQFSIQSCACQPFLSALALYEMHYHKKEMQSEASFFFYQNHVYRNSHLNAYYQTITTSAFVLIAVHSSYWFPITSFTGWVYVEERTVTLSEAHMQCELCVSASVCVHCWWADVYADEKSFGNVASPAQDEMRLAWLSQPSTHGSYVPLDAADKSMSALNATAVWMRDLQDEWPPTEELVFTLNISSLFLTNPPRCFSQEEPGGAYSMTHENRSRPRIHHPPSV